MEWTSFAITDIGLGRSASVAAQYGITKAVSSLDDLLEVDELDAVLNLTPIPDHGETCIKILDAGKHLATEKPLATTIEDADRICDLAETGALTVVCSAQHALPGPGRGSRLVCEGVLGKVAFARVRSSHGGTGFRQLASRPDPVLPKGSGPLFDMGVYGIHWHLGPAQRVVAFSGITEPVRTRHRLPYGQRAKLPEPARNQPERRRGSPGSFRRGRRWVVCRLAFLRGLAMYFSVSKALDGHGCRAHGWHPNPCQPGHYCAPASASPSSALLAWYHQHGDVERYEMLATIELIVPYREGGMPSQSDLACGSLQQP